MMEDIRIILVKIQKIRKGRFVDAVPLFTPNGVPLPVFRNIPVGLFGNKTNHIDWNIEEGDIMPYFILTFDISSYISQASQKNMDTNRRNNLNNGFILPFTIPNLLESLMFPKDIRIIGNRLEKGNINLTGNTVQTGTITSSGIITSKEDVIAQQISLTKHKHKNIKKGQDESGEPI